MRRVVLALAVVVSLAAAGAAHAGCMATVGLSPLPSGTRAGTPWTVDLTVLQHGVTPLDDATPSVIVTDDATGARATFPARLVDGPNGRYRADVTFPARGSWSVAVDDGFPIHECARTHTFGSFAIGAASTPPGPSPGAAASPLPTWPVVGGILGGAALLVTLLAVGRARPGAGQAASASAREGRTPSTSP